MGSRMKEDERHEKIVRCLLKLPENRRCINCNSLGPQYVCSNFATFICITCSGIHREFTHRVKSISMAKFTAEDVAALQSGGNERARTLFLKDWNSQRDPRPDRSNVDKLRDFIKNVYVERRYAGGPRGRPEAGDEDTRADRAANSRPQNGSSLQKSSYDDHLDEHGRSASQGTYKFHEDPRQFNNRNFEERDARFRDLRSPRRSDAGRDRQEKGSYRGQRRGSDDGLIYEDRPRWSVERYEDRPRHSISHFPDESNRPRLSYSGGNFETDYAPDGSRKEEDFNNSPQVVERASYHANGRQYGRIDGGGLSSSVGSRKDGQIAKFASFGNAAPVLRSSAALTRAQSDSLIDFIADPARPGTNSLSDPFVMTSSERQEATSVRSTGWATFDSVPVTATGGQVNGAVPDNKTVVGSGYSRPEVRAEQAVRGDHHHAVTNTIDNQPVTRGPSMQQSWNPFSLTIPGQSSQDAADLQVQPNFSTANNGQPSYASLQSIGMPIGTQSAAFQPPNCQFSSTGPSLVQTSMYSQPTRSTNPFDLPGDAASLSTDWFPSMNSLQTALSASTSSASTLSPFAAEPFAAQWPHATTNQQHSQDVMRGRVGFPGHSSFNIPHSTMQDQYSTCSLGMDSSGHFANGSTYLLETASFAHGLGSAGANPFN